MKRIFAMLSLLLAVLTGFSACGGEQPTPDEPVLPATTREEIENLLTTDYIVGYLWYCDGLPEKGELTEDEYLPVDEESGYATLRDLQELLDKIDEEKSDDDDDVFGHRDNDNGGCGGGV